MSARHSWLLVREGNQIQPQPAEQNKFQTQFKIIEKIGEGSFGVVYKCERSGQLVAVKRSKEPYQGVKDRLAKLEEVNRLYKLGVCQNGEAPVIRVIECWEEAGHVYISSELCEQGNLNDYLVQQSYPDLESKGDDVEMQEPPALARRSSLLVRTSETPLLAEKKIWKIFADMARGVQHVHDAGFVHLDVKPSNFLVTNEQRVKLGDFGVAVDLEQIANLPDNDQAGDAAYMAPELLKADVPLA